MGGRSPEVGAMYRSVLGKIVTPVLGARCSVFSKVRQFLAGHQKELGILEYQTWDAEGGYIQGIRVIKRCRLSPNLAATLPLLKRPRI